MSFPLGPKPSMISDMAFELGAVARITCAPPIFCKASAGFVTLLSMYTVAPSFFASAALSEPRPTAATLVTKLVGELNSKVTQAADAQHGDKVSWHGAAVAQRVVGGDSGAEERCRLGVA